MRDDDPETIELKKRYAEALLRLGREKTFAAAAEVLGDNGLALKYHKVWEADEVVKRHISFIIAEAGGEVNLLPDKAEMGRRYMQLAEQIKDDPAEVRRIFREYCELRGFIEKPGNVTQNTNILAKGVMLVQNNGSNSDWEEALITQQEKLLKDASA